MHIVFREKHGLEENEAPIDLDQSPADLAVLSFSDSDLGAFAEGWHRGKSFLPSLRLANLATLKHPLSVDTYIEKTLSSARGILIRLIGGKPYWPYGIQQINYLAKARGIALAVLPADGRLDTQLDAASTVPLSTLRQLSMLCQEGGPVAAQAALAQLSLSAGIYAKPILEKKNLPKVGAWTANQGIICPAKIKLKEIQKPLAVISFYRSFLSAADLAPIKEINYALIKQGLEVVGLFVQSLKNQEDARWIERQLRALKPKVIVNATAFSGIGPDGKSPLDIAGAPVFQVALATSTKKAWSSAVRGLSPTDLAMHVVLPEVDGRIFAGVASFKQAGKKDTLLEFSRFAHHPEKERVTALSARISAHVSLQNKLPVEKVTALILSTYPGKNWQMGHAVGLDALASANSILHALSDEGYDINFPQKLEKELSESFALFCLKSYKNLLKELPTKLQTSLFDTWGEPEADPLCKNQKFQFKCLVCGKAYIALQPERGEINDRKNEYHDTSRTPRHSYVAFYLWLRKQIKIDALVHIGAHGTLEWLPGKSVALSRICWPEALVGNLPVIYPFIVNDPGEASQAKRRIGAITLGHIPPPLKNSSTPERLTHLEALLDEFSNADGLDPMRRDRLQKDIRSEAILLGIEKDLSIDEATSAGDAITQIDRFVCDVKDSQFSDGLHIYGRANTKNKKLSSATSAKSELKGLSDALSGKRVAAGPSGSPYRGREDVLPTGRNLFSVDPRSIPTQTAYEQGVKLSKELVRRHLQDNGEFPKNIVVDLWGSATMRTAGEEFAMALHLLGVKPKWDKGSSRVSGIEIIPIAELDRPRIDVTLRISGLFRDVFPALSTIFSQAIRSLSLRGESSEWNPFIGADSLFRVFGPAPGNYGLNLGSLLGDFTEETLTKAGKAWINASSYAFDGENSHFLPEIIEKQIKRANSFVHLQDLKETDLLLASDYAGHEAGFAAALRVVGGSASLYHLDNTNPDIPKARALNEEIARVVRARATNKDWLRGMLRHGFRGAAEIAATLDQLAAFAHLSGAVGSHLFDLYYEATLADKDIFLFLEKNNPEALKAMSKCFKDLLSSGLWVSRRNSILASMENVA